MGSSYEATWQALTAYPLATGSSIAFYVLLLLLALPGTGPVIRHWLLPAPRVQTQTYVEAFDPIRGMASALVALGHCWWATYPTFSATQPYLPLVYLGAKAVPVFAVLSGFLIYRSVLAIRTLADLRAYALRRFFRIYPVYLLGVFLGVLFGQYVAGDRTTPFTYFLSDLVMRQMIGGATYANPVAWSLYIEAAFYVVLPLVVLTVGSRRMLIFSVTMLLVYLITDYPSRNTTLWNYFLFGIIASEISPRLRRVALSSFVLGMGLLAYDFLGPGRDWVANLGLVYPHDGGFGESVGLGLAMMLILASLPHLPRLSGFASILPLRLLGTISYSVYIVHFFYIAANFPQMGNFIALGPNRVAIFEGVPRAPWWYLPFFFFPGALFWGAVSYVLVERPGFRLGSRLANKSTERVVGPL